MFGVFFTAMTIHVFFMLPETAGKTLEEVEDTFLSKVPAWKTKVEYGRIRRVERGEIDPEKLGSLSLTEAIDERPTVKSALAKSLALYRLRLRCGPCHGTFYFSSLLNDDTRTLI